MLPWVPFGVLFGEKEVDGGCFRCWEVRSSGSLGCNDGGDLSDVDVIGRGGRIIEVRGGFIWLGRGIFVILWCY